MPRRTQDWSPGSKCQEEAKSAVRESARIPDFAYWGELPIGKTWAFTFSVNRDSSLLEKSNYETVKEDLQKAFPDDIGEERVSHFAVGWIDHLAVRMLDAKGRVTRAGVAALEWKEKLENYPVADEEDYSRREHEATLENLEFEGSLSEDEAVEVYRWLSENNPRALVRSDEGGEYASSEDIEEALVDLGLREPEEEEEEEPALTEEELELKRRREFIDPPEQLKLFGRRALRR